jgi:hypothetical protein
MHLVLLDNGGDGITGANPLLRDRSALELCRIEIDVNIMMVDGCRLRV